MLISAATRAVTYEQRHGCIGCRPRHADAAAAAAAAFVAMICQQWRYVNDRRHHGVTLFFAFHFFAMPASEAFACYC